MDAEESESTDDPMDAEEPVTTKDEGSNGKSTDARFTIYKLECSNS